MIYICMEPTLIEFTPFIGEIDRKYVNDKFYLRNCIMPARRDEDAMYIQEDLKGCWSQSEFLLDFNTINIIKYFGNVRHFTEEFKTIIKKELFSKI